MEKTVNAIAALVGGTVHGDGTRMIRGLASLDEAGANDLAFASADRACRRRQR